MATMEKPRKEKTKKKAKQNIQVFKTSHDDAEEEEECNTQIEELNAATTTQRNEQRDQLSLQDFEQFEAIATSSSAIVSRECFTTSANYKAGEIESEEEEQHQAHTLPKDDDSAENISLHEELAQAVATAASAPLVDTPPKSPQPWTSNFEQQKTLVPSAPPADVRGPAPQPTVVVASPTIMVQYPNLSPLQREETRSPVVYRPPKVKTPTAAGLTQAHVKPFTAEQLKQIYNCPELELVKQFELEFLMNSLLETYEGDPLHAALLEYYNLQSKLTMNNHDVRKYRQEALEAQEHIWVKVPITKAFTGRCGDNVEVRESVTYDISQVDGKNLENASAALTRLFDLVCFTYTSNLITAQIAKVKIDQIINEIISYPRVSVLAQDAPHALHGTLDADTLQCVAHLRRAISILFSFTRKLSPNAHFDADLKTWLRRLVSLHLLLATKEDHWFLLFNILRCPSGVGSWATEFLQVPCAIGPTGASSSSSSSSVGARASEIPLLLNSAEMNHCVATLQILLLPIKKRNDYLTAFTQSHKEISDPVKEERWILLDSDGEDSHTSAGDCVGLKESDLIALLNQIPFEKLFTSALSIEKFLADYIIESDLISANQMLKVVAFFAKLIEIFGEGMLTYNTERYKQLSKRLGRLVRHTLQYVSDYHELFICNNLSKDPFTCDRIAVELNALLIKACSYIYRTRNLATWQYFSSLPFNSLDTTTLWQMLYYLNVGFPTEFPTPHEDHIERFNASDFWTKFNVANADSSAEDMYYLLQAFFEMANERDKIKDWDLIKTICLHIFNIGYINDDTRDVCYKTARDMLVNLTLAYEDLMSCLLLQLKIRFVEIENAAYLFKSLPLENWKPGMDSFEIISNWLLHFDFKSRENMLARIVISHLNWGFDCDGRLFLPHNIHVRMACLVAEALTKHAPEVIGLSGISESVRQVSNLIDFTQSTKEQFTTWCWSMVSILRLHLMDQGVESMKRTLQNPTEPLLFVPDLERIEMIFQGVTENRPLALFVAILVSLHGHSIPLICQKGFELMRHLLNDHRHAAVIRCLEMIVPLFLEIPETLGSCEGFQAVLNTLLNADKTYLKMAKDIMYPNSIGPVLELLDNMIHRQIITYTNYGLSTPLNIINVWLNCLTALSNWQNTNAVYLLDKIFRVAYQFPDARLQTIEFFRYYFKDCDEWKGVNKMSTLKTLFGSTQLRIPTLSPYHGWFALVMLEIEFKTQDAHYWPELLRQIATANGKDNLDSVLKKTATVVKMSSFSPQMLVLYKYANLVASMDISHPVFLVLNQKFFELFLSRVPTHYDDQSYQHIYGVADKFYEYNVPLMKKIKTNLKAAETYYTNEATAHADDEALSYFYRNCAKMMKTYALWLEETTINKLSKDQHNFPPQYNNDKLREILNGNTSHWTEFIYLPAIRKDQKYQADKWARKCFRLRTTKRLRTPLQPKSKTTPIERIKDHLCSYDKRLDAPKYMKPEVNVRKEITGKTLKELKFKLKSLSSTATKLHFMTSELNSLNRNYLDIVLKLYQMVPYDVIKIKSCNSLVFNRKCTNPARISTTLENIRQDDTVARKVETYRERHDKLVDELLQLDVEDFAQHLNQLSAIIKILISSQMSDPIRRSDIVTNTGINFFYAIIENMTDITMKFQPTNDFQTKMLAELGVFLQENQEEQGLAVLELTLKRPDLLKVLSAVFVPYRTRPEYFLKMYKFLIDSHLKRCDTKILFVILSKFDLVAWLEVFHPKLYDITQLLQLVLRGLECWSQPDSSLLQDQFRRHLVHIFAHDFPQHYGEVMQMVLDRISDQKLMPVVLLDLLNALLLRFNCEAVALDTTSEKIQKISVDFARRQNLFNLKAATDTALLFARQFQKERLHHGLHGLYPKHKDYCNPLAMWFSCFGHVVVVQAICTYQELLADQISDVIFGSIIEMYSPWLITYTEATMQQQATANWIRQLTENGKMLHPWSEQHAGTSKIMIFPFINTITFVLDNLPVSNKILAHTFCWYVHHFAIPKMEPHIQAPIHEGIAALPWEMFKPQPNYIDILFDSLEKFIPESHAMLGHIFIRINWKSWFLETLPTYPAHVQAHVVSRLFTIFIKIAFEPNIHIHINTSKILEDAINYPWHMVEYAELENLLKWFVTTVEPSIVLKIPTETNYADRAVLDLLRLTCAMMPERATAAPISNATAKRILYARTFVRLLRSCAAKNQKLLATKDGTRNFNAAFMELLSTMDKSTSAIATTQTLEQQKREALNLMIEIIVPMQTQSEETSNLHVDLMIEWQQQCAAGNLLMVQTLNAIGHSKAFIGSIYALLESSIVNYFRTLETTKEWHTPTWQALLQTLQMSLEKLELMPILRGPNFFTLHIFILYKIEKIDNLGDKITFLQDLSQLVESLKTSQLTEPRLAIIWGIIISRGCKILSESENAKKPLRMLARHLQVMSTQSEGWGEGLLGVIGLQRAALNRRRVLTRCLACVILALFPDTSQKPNEEFESSLRELTMLLANKKFLDVKPLIVKAVAIIEEHKMPELRDVPHLICRLIALFYDTTFLTTIPEVWDFDFKLG